MANYLPPLETYPTYNPNNYPTATVDPALSGVFLRKAGDVATGLMTFNLGLVSGSQIQIPDGSALLPALTFDGDENTGLFRLGADNIAVSTGGTQRADVSTSAVTSTLPVLLPDGTAAAPAITASSDTNTGLFFPTADTVAISTGGTQRLTTSTTAVTSTLPVRIPGGSASAPGLAFSSDPDTGIANPVPGQINFSVDNALNFMRLDATSFYVDRSIVSSFATIDGSNGGISLLDYYGLHIINPGTATGAFAVTLPTGEGSGTVLRVMNLSGYAVTTNAVGSIVIPDDQVKTFVYSLVGTWLAADTTPRIYFQSSTSTTQSIAHNTGTNLTIWDNDIVLGGITNTGGQLTVPVDGIYTITTKVVFSSNPTGVRQVLILTNSIDRTGDILVDASGTLNTDITVASTVWLAAGSTINIRVFQTSGVNLTVGGTGVLECYLSVIMH